MRYMFVLSNRADLALFDVFLWSRREDRRSRTLNGFALLFASSYFSTITRRREPKKLCLRRSDTSPK